MQQVPLIWQIFCYKKGNCMDTLQLNTHQYNAYTLDNTNQVTNNSNYVKKTPKSKFPTSCNIFKCPNNSPKFKNLDSRDVNEASEHSNYSVNSQPLDVEALIV